MAFDFEDFQLAVENYRKALELTPPDAFPRPKFTRKS
ncbi:MAG: hypothetical protein CM1200mP2_34260 [Planctomycetaceae bacterium]|nr:MAG: hypothetical protein CM1200mP2_34260 [Planctomycetaceae bacterium]